MFPRTGSIKYDLCTLGPYSDRNSQNAISSSRKNNNKKKIQGNEDNSDRADALYVQFILGTTFTEVVIIA
jgi:hypothetical protein